MMAYAYFVKDFLDAVKNDSCLEAGSIYNHDMKFTHNTVNPSFLMTQMC